MAIFKERTAPLLDDYRLRGGTVETVEVSPGMTAERMWEMLEKTAGEP